MTVQALRLPAMLPALTVVDDWSPAFSDRHQRGMPRDGIVYVGYQSARFAQNYGADGRVSAQREGLGSIIDIFV